MNKERKIPQGITIIYSNEPDKNIKAELPFDEEQIKSLSRRTIKDAMKGIVAERQEKDKPN